jgi:myosin X
LATSVSRTQPIKDQCKATLIKIDTKAADFQLGHTKVFLRERLEIVLERTRHSALKATVAKIAAVILGYMQRRRYLAIRRKIISIEAWFVRFVCCFISEPVEGTVVAASTRSISR